MALALLGACKPAEFPDAPPPYDGAFDAAISEFDRARLSVASARRGLEHAAIGRALERLADALDALPDARVGEVTSLASSKVRADARRLLTRSKDDGARGLEVQGALLMTSVVFERLAVVVYADRPEVGSSARSLASIVATLREDRPLDQQRERVLAALAATELVLELVETEAANSPFPARDRVGRR